MDQGTEAGVRSPGYMLPENRYERSTRDLMNLSCPCMPIQRSLDLIQLIVLLIRTNHTIILPFINFKIALFGVLYANNKRFVGVRLAAQYEASRDLIAVTTNNKKCPRLTYGYNNYPCTGRKCKYIYILSRCIPLTKYCI